MAIEPLMELDVKCIVPPLLIATFLPLFVLICCAEKSKPRNKQPQKNQSSNAPKPGTASKLKRHRDAQEAANDPKTTNTALLKDNTGTDSVASAEPTHVNEPKMRQSEIDQIIKIDPMDATPDERSKLNKALNQMNAPDVELLQVVPIQNEVEEPPPLPPTKSQIERIVAEAKKNPQNFGKVDCANMA